jgi:hypothetical protein
MSLRGTQRELVRYLIQSPAFRALGSRIATRTFMTLLFRGSGKASSFATSEGLLSALGQRVLSQFEERAQVAITRYVEKRADRITRDVEERALELLDPEWMRQLADEVWDAVSHEPLATAASSFSAQDLEDFVVLSYEFWLKFRRTPYFRAVSAEVVDQLFETYGSETVSTLIEDMGVTESMVAHELRTFAAPLLEQASKSGFLEERVRAVLEPFYRSEAVRLVLSR